MAKTAHNMLLGAGGPTKPLPPVTPLPTKTVAVQPKKVPTVLPPAYTNSPLPKTTVSSGAKSPTSYNNVPASAPAKTAAPAAATNTGPDTWIDQLKKAQPATPAAPKLPAPIDINKYAAPAEVDLNKYKLPAEINLDQYKSELATIEDLASKYGFDYSREYAERQAQSMAQAQRDAIAASRERAAHELEKSKTDLQHDFFGKYLQQRQQLANSGLNAGIASERNLRLDMSRQGVLGNLLANAQLYSQDLDRQSARVDSEALANAERMYSERLQQGFGNAMELTNQGRADNQSQLNAALQQRGQTAQQTQSQLNAALQQRGQVSQERQQMLNAAMNQRDQQTQEAWREFEWNNMSASEKQKLIVESERYGMEMAWERHKFDAGLAFQAGYGGGY